MIYDDNTPKIEMKEPSSVVSNYDSSEVVTFFLVMALVLSILSTTLNIGTAYTTPIYLTPLFLFLVLLNPLWKIRLSEFNSFVKFLAISWVFLSLLTSVVHFDNKHLILRNMSSLLISLAILSIPNYKSFFSGVFNFSIICGLIYVLAVTSGFATWAAGHRLHWPVNANLVTRQFETLIPFALFIPSRSFRTKIITFGVLFWMLYLTKTRTGFFVLACLLCMDVLLPKNYEGGSKKGPLFILVSILGFFALYWETIYQRYLIRGSSAARLASMNGRSDLWISALKNLIQNPWVGADNTSRVLYDASYNRFFEIRSHAHNEFLQLGQSHGLPYAITIYLILITACLIFIRRIYSKNLSNDQSRYSRICLFVIVGGMIHSMADFPILQSYTLWGVITWGCALYAFIPPEGIQNQSNGRVFAENK